MNDWSGRRKLSKGYSDSELSGSVSIVRDWPGMRYQPAAQEPKSIVWQRSEQNGRKAFPSHVTGWRQTGQRSVLVMRSPGRLLYM